MNHSHRETIHKTGNSNVNKHIKNSTPMEILERQIRTKGNILSFCLSDFKITKLIVGVGVEALAYTSG